MLFKYLSLTPHCEKLNDCSVLCLIQREVSYSLLAGFPAALAVVDNMCLYSESILYILCICTPVQFQWLDPGTCCNQWLGSCNPDEVANSAPSFVEVFGAHRLFQSKHKQAVIHYHEYNAAWYDEVTSHCRIIAFNFVHIVTETFIFFYLWAAFIRIFFLSASFSCQRTEKTPLLFLTLLRDWPWAV